MGSHYTLINKTKKEYFDIGKYLNNLEKFQFNFDKYLKSTMGDIIIISDEDFDDEGYNEIEGF